MINTDAYKELMDALAKLFGSEMDDEEEALEDKPKEGSKGKTITIVSVGKGKPMPKGLKIPKAKKEMEDDEE